MVYNKAEGDLVYYLDYHTQVVTEAKIKSLRGNGNYNIVTAAGEVIRDAKVWLLYETREEALKQSSPQQIVGV